MAGKARRNFTGEFKAETVALLEGSGRPLSQMSRELGIEQSVLRTWRGKLRPPGLQRLGRLRHRAMAVPPRRRP